MPSHERTYHINARHQPGHELLEPCPHESHQHSTDSRQFPNRLQTPPLHFRPSLAISTESADALPAFFDDSVFQAPPACNPDSDKNNYPMPNFQPWPQFEQRIVVPEEDQHTLNDIPSSEILANPWFGFGLPSDWDSGHFSDSINLDNSHLDSCPDSLLGVEDIYPESHEFSLANTPWAATEPLDQNFSNSIWADLLAREPPYDQGSKHFHLDPVSYTTLGKNVGQFAGFADQTASFPNDEQGLEESWYQSTESDFQIRLLNETPEWHPEHTFARPAVPPNICAGSSYFPPLPSQLPVDVSKASTALPASATASVDLPQSILFWNPESHITLGDSTSLHIANATRVMPENTTATIKPITPQTKLMTVEPLNWEHISSTELKPHEAIMEAKHPRKAGGRRRGRLSPETAKDAQEMRHLRACLPCSMLKIKCTPGDVCKHCSGLNPPSLCKRVCTRAHLDDFTELLFPTPFVSHLQQTAVAELSRELSLGFVGNDMEVEFTCGHGYLPMTLKVSEFALRSDGVARVPTLVTESKYGVPSFQYQYPPPIASRSTCEALVQECRSHVKLVVKHQRCMLSLANERRCGISKMILEAVSCYHSSSHSSRNAPLLEKAMLLHAMYYFMGTTLTITDTSKEDVGECLRKPTMHAYDSNIISRLLNRQVKSAMNALRRDMMREVLEELERELKNRSKAMWATCFCVALILCICIEEAQIAMDAFTMHTRAYGTESEVPSSESIIETCRKLDDLLFGHLLELFHAAYKTHQISKQYNSGRAYNPIRDKPEIDVKEGLDPEAANLVIEIRKIIATHEKGIADSAETPSFGSGHDSLAQHMAFRRRNSARLVSTFLKSFHYT